MNYENHIVQYLNYNRTISKVYRSINKTIHSWSIKELHTVSVKVLWFFRTIKYYSWTLHIYSSTINQSFTYSKTIHIYSSTIFIKVKLKLNYRSSSFLVISITYPYTCYSLFKMFIKHIFHNFNQFFNYFDHIWSRIFFQM